MSKKRPFPWGSSDEELDIEEEEPTASDVRRLTARGGDAPKKVSARERFGAIVTSTTSSEVNESAKLGCNFTPASFRLSSSSSWANKFKANPPKVSLFVPVVSHRFRYLCEVGFSAEQIPASSLQTETKEGFQCQ